MDLERFKQSLRLRSGRSKKAPKKSKSEAPATTERSVQKDPPRPATAVQPNGRVETATTSSPGGRPSSQSEIKGKEQDIKKPPQRQDSGLGRSPPDKEERPTSFYTAKDYKIDAEDAQHEEVSARDSPDADVPAEPMKQGPAPRVTRTVTDMSRSSEAEDFDLRPPAPRPRSASMESMSELLFSAGHLHYLIYNPVFLKKVTMFIQKYRPQDYPLLLRYLETAKAIKAIEYANAVAQGAYALPQSTEGNKVETSSVAATLDESFKKASTDAFETLVSTSLPLYITYSLILSISECLVDEITGRSTPFMRDMVGGLSEVFCLTDPTQQDNPIIYASEEFYRLTGYGQDDVINHNCRFLQGPRTNQQSPQRIEQSLEKGEEIYETLLNYRRDGKPFLNLLMIAPLHDDKGNVKYHLGAQIDVSRLIETGRVLEGFQKYLAKRDADEKLEAQDNARDGGREKNKKREVLNKLRELSELFDLEESTIVQNSSRSASLDGEDDAGSVGGGNARRRIVYSDASEDESEDESTTNRQDWEFGQSGPLGLSGKLPGVYEKYMLIRPAPSLRIVFVSPKLRKFGTVIQSPFLSHVAAPASTLSGLAESFKSGIPVSAKINFLRERTDQRQGTKIPSNERHEDGQYGRACWMSATPLIGGDDRVGVWIVIFVEKAQANVISTRKKQIQGVSLSNQRAEDPKQMKRAEPHLEPREPGPPGSNQRPEGEKKTYAMPIKPKRLDAVHSPAKQQEGQDSASAYQYQAATPVEEYQSADEMERSDSPIVSAPRADMPPSTPEYEHDGEEEFVRPTSVNSPVPSPHRVRVDPDSDQEEQTNDKSRSRTILDLTENKNDDVVEEGELEEEEAPDPNNITPSIPSDHDSLSGGDDPFVDPSTRARSPSHEKDQNFGMHSIETTRQRKSSPEHSRESPRHSSPQSSSEYTQQNSQTPQASRPVPAGLGYMDYLRHPGSRKASEDIMRGRTRMRQDDETDCANSPYSVD